MKLEIKDLNVYLGDFQLKDINMTIPLGSICGLVGRNGAGKTTLIRTVANNYKKDSGQILYNDKRMEEDEEEIKKKLQVVFDEPHINKFFKFKKTIKLFNRSPYDFNQEEFEGYLEKFEVDYKGDLRKLSKGQIQKFQIALALSLKPSLLILDEATAGLDPISRDDVLDALRDFVADGQASVLISTHITSDLEKLVDKIVMIDRGEIILDRPRDLLDEAYRFVRLAEDSLYLNDLIGPRKTSIGYEGLIKAETLNEDIGQVASIEDIFSHLASKGETSEKS